MNAAALAVLSVMLLLAASFAAAPMALAAPPNPNRLSNATVSPLTGTTATTFTFSVRYRSQIDAPALSVTAAVAGLTIPLERTAGTVVDGTYAGTSTLPPGTWTVTFEAIAASGNSPTASAGPVQVSPPPTPTPAPTPVPPTPPPATPSPAASVPPAGASPTVPPASSSAGDGSASPAVVVPGSGGGGGTPGGDGSPSDDVPPWVLPATLGVLAAAGALGAWWILAARRRSREPEGAAAAAPIAATAGTPVPTSRPARRQPAEWELASALDDAPIGTVHDDDATAATDLGKPASSPRGSARGNARTRRMAEMHTWRDGDDQRSLLRRVGLPDEDGP